MVDLAITKAGWQRLVLIDVKTNTLALSVRFKSDAYPPRAWSDDLVGRYILDYLHDLHNPFPKRGIIGEIADREGYIEICFHGEKGSGSIQMDTVLSESKGICLGGGFKSPDGFLELTGKLRKSLLCPLVSAILWIGGRNSDCAVRSLIDMWRGKSSNDLRRRYHLRRGNGDDKRCW